MDVITISDAVSGASAQTLPQLGFNCFQWQAFCGDELTELLWAEPGFEIGDRRASGSGNPILFPFPGRLGGTEFIYAGRTYALEAGDGRGNAIHGFVHTQPWRVVDQTAASVKGEFHALADDASLCQRWPADFRIRATYTISASTLTLDLFVDNPGDVPCPFGLGLHPYFRVPLGGGIADECVVQVPARKVWQLDEMLPTGEQSPTEELGPLPSGMPFSEMQFDHVFTDVETQNGRGVARVVDLGSQRTLSITFDEAFRECVVYNPPHREAVCIEPQTCVPDAYRLSEMGHDTGLRVLAPGESFSARVEFALTGE